MHEQYVLRKCFGCKYRYTCALLTEWYGDTWISSLMVRLHFREAMCVSETNNRITKFKSKSKTIQCALRTLPHKQNFSYVFSSTTFCCVFEFAFVDNFWLCHQTHATCSLFGANCRTLLGKFPTKILPKATYIRGKRDNFSRFFFG